MMAVCRPCLPCLLVLSLHIVTSGGRRGGDIDDSLASVRHPGHRPSHVTRLHRNDHSGLAAMLEAEKRWSVGAFDTKLTLRGATSKKQFLKMSLAQVAALELHHSLEIPGQSEASAERKQASHSTNAGQEVSDSLQAIRQYHNSGRAVTGLSDLHSQYVGPIGVGSTLSPAGCCSSSDKAQASLLEKDQVICSVSSQEQVWVVFDTGSTNIWVASDLCKEGACVKKGRHRYNHTASATYAPPPKHVELSVQFGTGKLVGPHAADDFEIGPFSVHKQQFAMIEKQEGDVFDDIPFEGILGLAFPSMAAKGFHPFFDTIIQQKALEKNEFAFYFSNDHPAANAIFWGGVDPAFHEGDIEYYPVVDPFYWSLKLHSFRIGDEEFLGDGSWKKGDTTVPSVSKADLSLAQVSNDADAEDGPSEIAAVADGSSEASRFPRAIVDTGTSFFTLESDIFGKVMNYKLRMKKCNEMTDESHPPITLSLGSASGPRDIFLTHEQYMTKASWDSSYCLPAFMKIDLPKQHGPGMVLGETFLRNYMAVFDRQDGDVSKARIGFAKAVHSEETNSRLRELTASQPSFGGDLSGGDASRKPTE